MKRFVSMLLVLALGLTACSGNGGADSGSAGSGSGSGSGAGSASAAESSSVAPKESSGKNTLTVAIAIDPGSLNPYDRLENVGRQLWCPVYEPLFAYGEGDLSPTPVLADTYEFSEDQKDLTIHLKQGIKFHNGEEMKASDVVYSFEMIHKKSPAHMGDIDWDNVKALDDYTVFIPYNSVQGLALYYLCNLYIISEKHMTSLSEEQWSTDCVGTGPYMWGDFIEGSEYNLIRFDDYREKKKLDKIVVRIIPDSNVQKIEIETGGVDLACGLQFSDLASFKDDKGDGVEVMPSNVIAIMELIHCFPDGKGPLADIRVRQALSYSLNLEAINKIVFSNQGAPATAIYPSGVSAYAPAENQREYSVEKAKALLAEAGYPDGVTIDFYCQNTSMFQMLADVMTGMCEEAGITLNVIMSDFATVEGNMGTGNKPGVYTLRQYVNGDPYILINYFFSKDKILFTKSGHNTDEKFQEACELREKAFLQNDIAKRNEIYHELMQIVYDRAYYEPVIEYADQVAYTDAVKGFWMAGPIYHYEDCYFE